MLILLQANITFKGLKAQYLFIFIGGLLRSIFLLMVISFSTQCTAYSNYTIATLINMWNS
ncbi:UNVERIFIED_CONTAM: DUF4133 domain-containing protein [Ralstonia mannitolilytica]